MSNSGPHVIVLGGPDGSGKSTAAGHLDPEAWNRVLGYLKQE